MAGAASVPTLRDTLSARLATLRNGSELGLTVLTSTPKRTTAIFPHAPSTSVKCWDTEYLIVVSAGVASTELAKPTSTDPSPANPASSTNGTPAVNGTTPSSTRVLAAAISCHLYTLPSSADAPSSILYISKVDSSGYAPSSGPITRVLASGVLAHFLSPLTRPGGARGSVTATLFARAQGQYLFPNSAEGGSKRVLGGLGLCQWWKGVYEEAAGLLINPPTSTPAAAALDGAGIHLAYVLPSYAADEARGILGAPRRPLPPGVGWVYTPPFNSPLFGKEGRNRSLATLIPSLPDDPKTRFLDELVDSATDIKHNEKGDKDKEAKAKAKATPLDAKRSRSRRELEAAEEETDRRKAYAVLAKIPLEEFWERMGFRQECVSGDVTGFFSFHVGPVSSNLPTASSSAVAGVETAESEKEKEKENRRAEGREGDENKEEEEEEAKVAPDTRDADETASTAPTERSTESATFVPPRPPHTIPQPLVERILKSLLNTDFGNRTLAYAGTSAWLASMRALVVDEVGEVGYTAATATIAPKDVSSSAEAPAPKRKEEAVTMLQPRKKKRA